MGTDEGECWWAVLVRSSTHYHYYHYQQHSTAASSHHSWQPALACGIAQPRASQEQKANIILRSTSTCTSTSSSRTVRSKVAISWLAGCWCTTVAWGSSHHTTTYYSYSACVVYTMIRTTTAVLLQHDYSGAVVARPYRYYCAHDRQQEW